MNAHLSELELDSVVAGLAMHPRCSVHLSQCSECQTRLRQMAAAELELLLAGAAAFQAPPVVDEQEEVEHSQVRYVAELRAAMNESSRSTGLQPRVPQRMTLGRQLLASCAMLMALTVPAFVTHPLPQSSATTLGYTKWLTTSCHASQPWCSTRAN